MKLMGTLVVSNRLAQAAGLGSKSKLGRPSKCMLQIRNKSDGHQRLVICTRKDVGGQDYDVTNIQKLRTQFVKEGIATIEIRTPPMDLMLRDCDPGELQEFISAINLARGKRKGEDVLKEQPELAMAGASRLRKKSGAELEEQGSTQSLRKSSGAVKRPRSPEPQLSKTEMARIKKSLQTNVRVINVRKRENYPKEFHSTVEHIFMIGIGLRKIDERILKLKYLAVLDLTGNRIKSVNELVKLNAPLQILILSGNEIEHIRSDFFCHSALCKIAHLDLSNNKLKLLPTSVVELHGLVKAVFSNNKLLCLPYNWMDLKSLQALNISNNQLSFLPATIQLLDLPKLDLSLNAELQVPHNNDRTEDYVGYSSIPTLFESCCEVLATAIRKGTQSLSSVPNFILEYTNACKYCISCSQMCLRYKIQKRPVSISLMAIEAVKSTGPSFCAVKKIVCFDCDKRSIS